MINFSLRQHAATLLCIGLTMPLQAQEKIDSLDIKIGQMILTGTPGTRADSATLNTVRQGKVGAILLFEKNISPRNAYSALKKMTWAYKKAAPIPLLVAIDQEGGRVNRLKPKYGFPTTISALAMGKSIDSVQFYGEIIGATLAGLGINVNLAPVVDVAVNPANPVIAKLERAFSAQGDAVARDAQAFIQTHHKMNVLTVLKHFPGHGSAAGDTHLGLVDVTDTWRREELKPYETLIRQGCVDAIMTAHIVNKALEPSGKPATLSEAIINGLLRGELGYEGVVVSDDMQMGAITQQFAFEEAIRLAINAGVDVLLFSNNRQDSKEYTADKVHATIRNFVEKGDIAAERIDQSFRRIMRLKKKLIDTNTSCR